MKRVNSFKTGGLRTKGILKHDTEDYPLVTIITVVFNAEKTISQTIESVISQTYPNIEYIVIDGGSTDTTLSVLFEYEDKIDFWMSEQDDGIYHAMNKGLCVANGEWINFLNAEDSFFESKSVFKAIHKAHKCDVLYGKALVHKVRGQNIISGRNVSRNDFYFQMPICHQALFTRRKVFSRVGVFDTAFKVAGDNEWLLRCFFDRSLKICFHDEVIVNYIGGGYSSQNGRQSKKEKYLIANRYFPSRKNRYKNIYNMGIVALVRIFEFVGLMEPYRTIKYRVRPNLMRLVQAGFNKKFRR